MKRSLKELTGYAIKGEDGTTGNVKDFLFDENKWIIRYLEADLGKVFPGRKVLIPNFFLKILDYFNEILPVKINKVDI